MPLSTAMLRCSHLSQRSLCRSLTANMSSLTYASAASHHLSNTTTTHVSQPDPSASEPVESSKITKYKTYRKPSPSSSHSPKTERYEPDLYVLTIQTDAIHHRTMTELRSRYFPKHLNKLDAHLTLFHALPGSKLESSVIPAIEHLVKEYSTFRLNASRPFRMKRGIAIAVPRSQGREQIHRIRQRLLKPWQEEGFLSGQDASGTRPHYTIMNKVDDEETVAKAFEEVSREWKGDWGMADGLGLWKYDHGFWKQERTFPFTAQKEHGK